MGNDSKPAWAHLRLTDAIEPGVRVLLVGINPGRHVGDDRASLRGADQPVLGPPLRSRHRPEPITHEDDVRLPEWGIGMTNLVARPSPGIDDSESGGVSGRLEDPREEDRALSSGDRGVRRRDDVPRAVAGPRPHRGPCDQAGVPERDRPRRAAVRAAESRAGATPTSPTTTCCGVPRARRGDQCAPAVGPRPRGFFISSTSGSSSRKITPSSRKIDTNATIVACCATEPNSAA